MGMRLDRYHDVPRYGDDAPERTLVTAAEYLRLIADETIIRPDGTEIAPDDGPFDVRPEEAVERGGPGSGHHGHEGRPGERGGSLPSGISEITNEVRGYHDRQTDGIIRALDASGKVAGFLDWAEFDDVVSVQMVEVRSENRRMGIATALMNRLKQDWPEEPIYFGYSTEEGTALRGALEKQGWSFAPAAYQQKPYEGPDLLAERGGPGSGHFGHEGRPGQRGGSEPGDGGDFAIRKDLSPGEVLKQLKPLAYQGWSTNRDAQELMEGHVSDIEREASMVSIHATEPDGDIVGFVDLTYNHPGEVYIGSMASIEGGRGIGTALLNEVFHVAASRGSNVAGWSLPRAENFWRNAGFTMTQAEGLARGGGGFIMRAEDVQKAAGMVARTTAEEDEPAALAGPRPADVERGGPGSGHFGHEGRPGEVGGSAPGGGTAPTSPEEFRAAFEGAMETSPYSAHVSHYSGDELGQMAALLLSEDGHTGVAVKDHEDGRIEATALFNQGGKPGAGLEMLRRAVEDYGVNYVEAFGPYLPKLYERLGFEVQEKYPFDPDQAPPNWNYDRFGRPDYFIMRMKEGA